MLRWVRGFVMTTAIFGAAASVFGIAAAVALWFTGGHQESDRLLNELAVSGSMCLRYGLAVGAILASLLIIGERSKTLESVSNWRFRFWGVIAGALPVFVSQQMLHSARSDGGYKWEVFAVTCGGFIGWNVAAGMLWLARRTADRRGLQSLGNLG